MRVVINLKEFLDLNKINYAKADRLTSKKDGRVVEMFKLEIQGRHQGTNYRKLDLSHNRYCYLQGGRISHSDFCTAVLEVPKFWPFRPKLVGPKPNVLSVGRATIIKDAQIKTKNSQNAPVVKSHMLHPTKSVQHTKTGI